MDSHVTIPGVSLWLLAEQAQDKKQRLVTNGSRSYETAASASARLKETTCEK